jgi:hypothetical protein
MCYIGHPWLHSEILIRKKERKEEREGREKEEGKRRIFQMQLHSHQISTTYNKICQS